MRHISTGDTGWHLRGIACAAALVIASPLVRAQKPAAAPPVVPAAAVTGTTMDRVRAAGAIRIGYRADTRPFSYRDDAGQATGYANRALPEDRRRGEGRVRTRHAAGGVGARDDRQAPHGGAAGRDRSVLRARTDHAGRATGGVVLDSGLPGWRRRPAARQRGARLRDVLAGRTPAPSPLWRAHATQVLQARDFVVVAGSPTEQWLNGRMKDLDIAAKIAAVSAIDAGVQAVRSGTADVLFAERSVLLDAARRSASPGELVVLDRMFTTAPLALAFRRGDDDFRLLVDRTLSRLYSSGDIEGCTRNGSASRTGA